MKKTFLYLMAFIAVFLWHIAPMSSYGFTQENRFSHPSRDSVLKSQDDNHEKTSKMDHFSQHTLTTPEISSKTLKLSLNGSSNLQKTKEGRELLKYVARCALKKGTQLKTTVDGIDYTFPGAIGLAPEWLHAPLSESGQRWISACLLAHVNAFGIHVGISIRGPHPSLIKSVSSKEKRDFNVQEAAFYGNLFTDPPVSYACMGNRKGSSSEYLKLRVCSELSGSGIATRCGFISMGYCGQTENQTEKTCETEDKQQAYLTQCHSKAETYNEVITVFLRDSPML